MEPPAPAEIATLPPDKSDPSPPASCSRPPEAPSPAANDTLPPIPPLEAPPDAGSKLACAGSVVASYVFIYAAAEDFGIQTFIRPVTKYGKKIMLKWHH